ncbi:MAG: hypothetical protein KGQ66_03365 [Acidobacteriota bacterium]|nr:hypothetical protein [Acidobacteriota bacterium]
MVNMGFLDDEYINRVKQTGSPPPTVESLASDPAILKLFETYAEYQDEPNLDTYVEALWSLKVEDKNADVVWNEVKDKWAGSETNLYELLDPESLKESILQETTAKLEKTYGEFLQKYDEIKSGGFDGTEDQSEEGADEMSELLEDLIVELDKKPVNEIKWLAEVLSDEVNSSQDELESELMKLKNAEVGNQNVIKEFRRSSKIDVNEIHQLLDELQNDEIENDPRSAMISELAEVTQDKPKDQILQLIDLDELQATENELDQLFDALDELSNTDNKRLSIQRVRRSSSVNEEDLQKLLEDLGTPINIDPVWNDRIDKLLDELVDEAPGNTLTKPILQNILPNEAEMSSDEFDKFLDGLVKLNEDKAPAVLRRMSSMIDVSGLDRLIAELQQPPAGQKRPEAFKVDDWNQDFVTQRNYDILKLNEGGTRLDVMVCGEYVLIGAPWDAEYTNGFLKAYEGDADYPAGHGLVETGKLTVEKGSGLFNPGTITIEGISAGRNRTGITETISAKSKKKIVFVD